MIVVVVGPTAVGKTKMGIELAKIFDGEIINADSTQVYKGMDIATAKVTKDEMQNITHHLIDIKDINEDYTVYDYQRDCRIKIEEISKKGKTPVIVGGTGLYISASLYDYKFENEIYNNNYDGYTNEDLYKKLLEVDPKTSIHKNNRKRVIRALNYYENNNKPFSEKETTKELLYDAIFIGLTTSREILYSRINRRVDMMLEDGLLDETRKIYKTGIRNKAVLTPIGYKELFPYLEGTDTLENCVENIKKNSRRYAKRQYTWFNNQMKVKWFDVDFENFNNTVNEVYQYILEKS